MRIFYCKKRGFNKTRLAETEQDCLKLGLGEYLHRNICSQKSNSVAPGDWRSFIIFNLYVLALYVLT